MAKIIVVNESPTDVFSKHLSGKESFEVIRLGFSEIIKGNSFPDCLILTVNHKLDLAVKIKKVYPNARVASVFGGEKDFQSVLTFVYGLNDYDDINYSSWDDFDRLLLQPFPRPVKQLVFSRSVEDINYYVPNRELFNKFQPDPGPDFADFLADSVDISRHFLKWMHDWILEVKQFSFPVKLPANKKMISQLQFSVRNEYLGLPLFSIGDRVILSDEAGSELSFYSGDLLIESTVIMVDNAGVTIRLSKPVVAWQLIKLKAVKLSLFLQSRKIIRMNRVVQLLLNGFSGYYESLSVPASFVCSAVVNPLSVRQVIQYPNEIGLDESSRKILRDTYQVSALMDILSDTPISTLIGPAGTGKTFVSAIAVRAFIDRGYNVLLVSHSNLGVDNLVIEVAKHVGYSRILRLGNNLDVISPEAQKFHMSNRPIYHRSEVLNDFISGAYDDNDDWRRRGTVIAATIDGFLTLNEFKNDNFQSDVIFCDEASKGLCLEIFPLFLAARKKLVLIGDNKQLGNIPVPKSLKDYLYEISRLSQQKIEYFCDGFFNSLVGNQYLLTSMLRVNRRSLPKIVEIVNTFYEGKLIPGRFNPNSSGSVIFLDTKELCSTSEYREGSSWNNPLEVSILLKRLMSLAIKNINDGRKLTDLVVITPYMAQVRLLKKKLRNNLLFHTSFKALVNPENIDEILEKLVITVDAIQGGQRKDVLTSLVRSNDDQEIGFNKDIRRFNVAMSRAQDLLIIIGNSEPFIGCDHESIKNAFLQILELVKRDNKYFILKN